MNNKEIAALFIELANIMEIAGENHFKVKAYRRAAKAISDSPERIAEMPPGKIAEIEGIGKAISEKIEAIKSVGTFPTLEKWRHSGFASFLPVLRGRVIDTRKLRGLISKYNLASLDDMKRAIDDRVIDDKALGAEILTIIKGS